MGVPKFYRWISERYPCLSEVVQDEQIPEFDNLYLDMNGIIHACSHPDDEDVSFRISEEQIFRDIFNYVDFLFGIIKPKKVFFMAVDGVAPRAKMNQQRARRFMSAKNAQEALNKAKKKGIEIPDEKPFDSNCITPGTQFMARLHEQLQYFVQMKITTDSCWQGLRIYLSGHNCPGEGEHKIMDFIRSERSQSDYNANTRHCLYGLDADLIMLGICSHEPHFALLREEVKFGRQKNRNGNRRIGVDEITFHLLHLSLLREYLSWEFHSLKSVIDDWVLMGFLVGNDFIPHLPHVHIHEDALPLLYNTYNEVLPQLDGYINEAGILNLKRFEIFLKNFAKNDKKNFMEQMDDEAYLISKRTSNAWKNSAFTSQQNYNEDLQQFDLSNSEKVGNAEKYFHKGAFDSDSDASNEYTEIVESRNLNITGVMSHGYFGLDKDSDNDLSAVLLDDESYENDYDLSWTPVVNRAFKNHKRDYYNDKMKYNNISKEELREQAEGYIRAIQWNLHYYYHGCCSWSWFYPHHYAPYISDVSDFAEMKMNFDLNEPFKPFEQLLAVLPAASADCLPPPYRELMSDPKSPIIDFYPDQFDTDLNGKKNDWEAVVLIPFIREDCLLQATALKDFLLTDEERQRNVHGPHLLFTYDPVSSYILKSRFPGTFPDIEKCKAKVEEIDMNHFRISRSQIVYGLLPGVKLDVIFRGFPTMKHIPHTAELQFADIKVFQQSSKKQSMILKILNRPEFEKDMLEIAYDLVGKEIHVNWPVLQKAFVQELWTAYKKYSKTADEEIICDNLSKEEQNMYNSYVSIARRNEFERKGIDIGEQKGLALVRTVQGLQKCFEKQQVIIKRSYPDTNNTIPVSLSLVVQNALEDLDSICSLEVVYPINAQVFISSAESKYYGFCGFIKENHLATKGTLIVSCKIPPTADLNFYDVITNYDTYSLKWYSVYEVARFLRTTVDVISRITGCVYVLLDELDSISSKRIPSNKINIGLELKFTKRNQIMPDFTCRSSEGHWLYSSRAFDIIRNYKMKYPGIFKYLEKLDNFQGHILIKQIFPEFKDKELNAKLKELKDFLYTIAPNSALESADNTFLDSGILKEVEKRIQIVISKSAPKQVCKRLAVKPRAIFMVELCKGNIMPDPKAEFRLLDRVICVKKLRAAPFGEFGTVIGLLNTGSEMKIDVLFDKPYFGGQIMRSGKASGARLPMSSLINLTHGKRVRKEIPMIEHILKPVTACTPRNEWESSNSQASYLNDFRYNSDFGFETEKQSSATVTTLNGKRKPQVRRPCALINNSLGSESQGLEGEHEKLGNNSNANVVQYSGKIKNSFGGITNFGNVEANKNIVKKDNICGIFPCDGFNLHREYPSPEISGLQSEGKNSAFSNCTFDKSRNYDKTMDSPKQSKISVIKNTNYGKAGLSGVNNIISKQLANSKNVGSRLIGNMAVHDDEKITKNRKLHHGYSRTWFGYQSVKPKDYLPCSSERAYTEQSSFKSARIQERISLDKKTINTVSTAPITLLKKKNSQDVGVMVLSAAGEGVEESETMAKSRNEKQKTTDLRENSVVERLNSTEQLSKQQLDTSGESSNVSRLPATRLSPKSTISAEKIVLRKDRLDYNQNHATSIISAASIARSAAQDDIKEATETESRIELNLYDRSISVSNTVNSTLPSSASRKNKRRPRKSRVVANLGFDN